MKSQHTLCGSHTVVLVYYKPYILYASHHSKGQLFKGTVQRDFQPLFFSSIDPNWATDQWVIIFSILV